MKRRNFLTALFVTPLLAVFRPKKPSWLLGYKGHAYFTKGIVDPSCYTPPRGQMKDMVMLDEANFYGTSTTGYTHPPQVFMVDVEYASEEKMREHITAWKTSLKERGWRAMVNANAFRV